MKTKQTALIALLFCISVLIAPPVRAKESWIVKDGQPMAAIVIAPEPKRLVKLAAEEMQEHIEKISGAKLPILQKPDPKFPATIYIGRSAGTDALGVTNEGLKDDAFRMVSGPDYLVLQGKDFAFVPEPKDLWPDKRNAIPAAQARWQEVTGRPWILPTRKAAVSFNPATNTNMYDESGSMNAVYQYLRSLGVRWYMPGELGRVTPKMASIPLPQLDETVTPGFPLRNLLWYNYTLPTRNDVLWGRRIGLNSGYKILGAGMTVHGMRLVMYDEKMMKEHPEYYAVISGKRVPPQSCFSSEGLFQDTVKMGREIFDKLGEPAFSVWPLDGYVRCECEECSGKSDSDLVFGFLDRVAKELYKTHPDRLVTGGAYSAYRLPPESINKFSPNVAIFLAYQRPALDDPQKWKKFSDNYLEAWIKKLPEGRFIFNSNNLYVGVIHPHSYVREIRARKGRSLGDMNEVKRSRDQQWQFPGLTHLNLYVNASLLWNPDQNLDALLDEYFALFYGPAKDKAKEAFVFAEAHYGGKGKVNLALEDKIEFAQKLLAAKEVAGETIYGNRIQVILDDLGTVDDLRKALAIQQEGQARKDVPIIVGKNQEGPGEPQTYSLKVLRSNEEPEDKTTFQVSWEDNALVFDILCMDPDMENLSVSRDVYSGDSVAILLEPSGQEFGDYYHIEINPDGEVADAARVGGLVRSIGAGTEWNAQAKVTTEKGKDFWRVKVKIPVVDESLGNTDPRNFVVGSRPTEDAPWFLNVGRSRIRGEEKIAFIFSPTKKGFHEQDKFARLIFPKD